MSGKACIDIAIILLTLVFMIWFGLRSSRNNSASKYFLAGRTMPGWIVGVSIFATLISSMSFIALPAFSFKENWRYIPGSLGLVVMTIIAMIFFVPFFRKVNVPSGYEYLERRFGQWARLYVAAGFILYTVFRTGIILYAVTLPVESLIPIGIPSLIIILGLCAAIYTITGGLEAIIWTDLIQCALMLIGALILLPVIISLVPGGVGRIITEAAAEGKMSLGSFKFTFLEKTFWVMFLASLVGGAGMFTTTQDMIQRYRAPKSTREARKAVFVSSTMIIPVWFYFTVVGTALWVFYRVFPDPIVSAFAESAPEKIVPYFVSTKMPVGLSGFVFSGIIMAAISTLASSVNSCATTLTYDFYQPFFSPNSDDKHSLLTGRIFSTLLGMLMIIFALLIHFLRNQTLQDLQMLMGIIAGAGAFGLFLIGFLSRKVDNFSAFVATAITSAITILWLVLDSSFMQGRWPILSRIVPDTFWVAVFANAILFAIAYVVSRLFRRKTTKDLTNLTLYTLTLEGQDAKAEQFEQDVNKI